MTVKNKFISTTILSLFFLLIIITIVPPPQKNKELINEFWIKKTHKKYKKNIVIGGDSRVYRGVSVRAFLENAPDGLDVINLGFSSAGYSNEYIDFLISRINHLDSPKILILGITPHSLTENALKNKAFHQYKRIQGFKKFRGLYLSKYLKVFSPYKLSDFINSKYNISNGNYFENFTSAGWVGSSRLPMDSTKALINYKKIFSSIKVNKGSADNLCARIKKLTDNGVIVIVFRPPTTMQMENLEDTLSGFNESQLKKSLIYNGAHWVDFSNSDYVSYDGSHLHYLSAHLLSNKLGSEVNLLLSNNKSVSK